MRVSQTIRKGLLLQNCRKFGYLSDFQLIKGMLQSYRKSTKKSNQLMKDGQLSIFTRILSESASQHELKISNVNKIAQNISFFRSHKLLNTKSLDLIEKWVQKNWEKFNSVNKFGMICFLVEQCRYAIFKSKEKELEVIKAQKQEKNSKIWFQSILHSYCRSVVKKKVDKIQDKLWENMEPENIFNVYPNWKNEIQLFFKAQRSFNLEKGLQRYSGKKIRRQNRKGRSVLEIQVETLLKTQGLQFEREFPILGLNVDFIVNKNQVTCQQQQQKQKQTMVKLKDDKFLIEASKNKHNLCFLEVMGFHHYTVENKVFGSDLYRAMVLENIFPLAMVHANDLNPIKGVQNRLEYLREVVNSANYRQKQFDFKGWSPKNEQEPNISQKHKVKGSYDEKNQQKTL